METAIDDLLHKVRLIAETPKGELLRQLVDLLYERVEEEYDLEPLTDEDLKAIRRGKEDIAAGRCITLKHMRKNAGCEIYCRINLGGGAGVEPAGPDFRTPGYGSG